MVLVLSPPSPPPTRIAKCTPDSIPITGEKPLLRRFLLNLPSSQTAFPLVNRHHQRLLPLVAPKASVGSAEYIVEPGTKVEFPKELKVPGCSESLILLGTGFREKVFAIIGVKIYAAGFYAEASIREKLGPWRGKPADEIIENSAIFRSILQEPLKKTLKIMLVRNVDGKTFWEALNDAISSRIKVPTTADEVALSTFGNTFQTRDLKNGTLILLTWVEPSKMLVSVSSDGLPRDIDAAIESENVTMALFDGYFGDSPVSPTLKSSVADGITVLFN